MDYATDILRKEHEAILRMLEAAEQAAARLEQGAAISADIPANLLEFFRLFADACHHGKEEELLFPTLERKGMPRNMGPIGVMLHEHDQGRALIRQMAEASEALAKGDAAAGKRWAAAARQYAWLLREHIMKENEILFVMAERMLSDSEQDELVRAFATLERDKMGAGTHERLHAMMDSITAELAAGVAR